MPPLARGQGLCDIDSLELLKKFQNKEDECECPGTALTDLSS